jgi:thiamine biosynthesis lipoprotein
VRQPAFARRREGRRAAALAACVAAAVIAAAIAGCGAADSEMYESELFAMDTFMRLSAYGRSAEDAVREASGEITRLDGMWSVTDTNSEIYALNSTGRAEASPETLELIEYAASVSAETGGALDITVYPAVRAWGFTADEYRVPGDGELRAIMPLVNYRAIKLDGAVVSLAPGAAVDFGALAKGYASQRAAEIFRKHGVTSGIVSLGGNVQTLGRKPDGSLWNVAIQDPEDGGRYAGILRTADAAVVTSGVYQRYFETGGERYHHIIDPATCRPADSGLLSVTVIADSGTQADALSTALFVMGRRSAEEYWRRNGRDFDMILITEAGEVIITDGIADSYTHANTDRTLVELTD